MRHILIAAIVLLTFVHAEPAAVASATRDERRVIIVDGEGSRRFAYMHWTVVLHERDDVVTGANGTLKISYDDTADILIWRVSGAEGQVSGSTGSDRQAFLRLLLTPVGPAKSTGGTTAMVSFDQPSPIDQTGRIKVQFSWDVEGVGSINATGDITIKGKKILQN